MAADKKPRAKPLNANITALFWDVGGVFLSNGWDRAARKLAVDNFGLDWEEFEDRHDLAFPAFEMGQCSLDQYLERTIFYRSRSFTREQFKDLLFAQSREHPETRRILDQVAGSGKFLMATINNEAKELNEYRIQKFELRRNFSLFFSSCFIGVRKPDEAIYRFALQVTQRAPQECLFIDDRALNLESAARLGMATILYQNAAQLRKELESHGVRVASS